MKNQQVIKTSKAGLNKAKGGKIFEGSFIFYQFSNNCEKLQVSLSTVYLIAQSICTHYSFFENIGGFVTLKKAGLKYRCKKHGEKKQGQGEEAA